MFAIELRFCPRCRADVEDVGGFCLLGHRLPQARGEPIADLRVQIDEAFSKVEVEVAKVFETEPVDDVSPSAGTSLYEDLAGDDQEVAEDMRATSRKIYDELSEDAPVSRTDPIIAFSPSPRAEWGPEKGNGKRSRR